MNSAIQLTTATLALFLLGIPAVRAEVRAGSPQVQAQVSVIEECDRLAGVINQTALVMADFEADIDEFVEQSDQAESLDDIKAAAGFYINAINRVVMRLHNLAVALDELTLVDEQLGGWRDDYADIVRGFASALTAAAEAMVQVQEVASEEELPAAVEASQQDTFIAVEEIGALSDRESQTIDAINEYCHGEP